MDDTVFKGMYIRPGHEPLVSIIGEKTITTDTALQRFDPVSRDCYDENEFNLKHFRNKTGHRYSIDNCLYESLVERIIESCNCTPFIVTWNISFQLPKCR